MSCELSSPLFITIQYRRKFQPRGSWDCSDIDGRSFEPANPRCRGLKLQPRRLARWGASFLKNIKHSNVFKLARDVVLHAYSVLCSVLPPWRIFVSCAATRTGCENISRQAPSYDTLASYPLLRSLTMRLRIEYLPVLRR